MTENYNNISLHRNDEEESSIRISDIWNMIWGYKGWYIISVIVCLFAVAVYIYRTPDTYNRTAKVIIDESNQDATMRSLGALVPGALNMNINASLANEIQALSSPDLMQVVVERLSLETRYVEDQFLRKVELYVNSPVDMRLAGENPHSFFSFTVVNKGDGKLALKDFVIGPLGDEVDEAVECMLGDTVVTPAGRLAFYPTAKIDDFNREVRVSWNNSMSVAKHYCRKLNVANADKESTVVAISLEDNFPSRASDIISTLLDIYNEEWIQMKNESARNTSAFINDRLIIIEKELGGIENDLKQYKQENRLTDMDAISRAYVEETSTYSTKAFEVTNQLSIAQYIKDYLNNPTNENALIPANLGLTTGNVESQISEYNELILRRDRLSTGASANNPIIADLNASISALRSAILRSVDNSIATLQLQATKIQDQENQIMSRIAMNSGQELQLLSIQRQQMVKESLYIFLLQKREENELAALINVGNTRLIMRPNGSSAPVAPNKMMLLLAALVLGFGIPFGVIFLIRVLDTTVKSKDDFNDLSVPFLAEIPLSVRKNKIGFISKADRFNNDNCRIFVEHGKRDMMNEAFRVFRTNLDMVVDKKPGEAFVSMFTSFNPNVGKTFVIQNIAASMSLKGANVLILDLDLRKATLSKALDKEHRGVSAYLNGKISDYHDHVDQIAPNLSVLPVGKLPPNPTELLVTDRFTNMIKSLRTEYDYIFIDCPPIDIVADSAIITKYVDMTILVVRAGVLDKRLIPMIEANYNSGKYTRMAVVLNGIDMESRRYGSSSYGYSFGYGYGNSD